MDENINNQSKDSLDDILTLSRIKSYSSEYFIENSLLKELKTAYDKGVKFLKWDPKMHEIDLFVIKIKLPNKKEKALSLFKEIVFKTWYTLLFIDS